MFEEDLARNAAEHIHPREGACGICHAVAEEVCRLGGKVVAYEKERGILARILDDKGEVIWTIATGTGSDSRCRPHIVLLSATPRRSNHVGEARNGDKISSRRFNAV